MGLGPPTLCGMGLSSGQSPTGARSAQRAAGVGLFGVVGQLVRTGQGDDAQTALKKRADVFIHGLQPFLGVGAGALRVGPRGQALAVGDVEAMFAGVVAHRRRIPAGGDEPQRRGGARRGDVENGEVAGVGVGDEQHPAVRRQGEAVGRVARRGVGVQGATQRLQIFALRRVHHAHLRRVGAGDVQGLAVRRQGHFRRVRFRLEGRDDLRRRRVDDGDAGLAPQADEQSPALGVGQTGVGIAALVERNGAAGGRVVQRHDGDRVAPGAGREQGAAGGVHGHAGDDERVGDGRHGDFAVVGQQALVEGEGVDDRELAAAGVQRLAVGGKADPVKRLIEADAADDARPVAAHPDDDDFVFAEARVEDGRPFAAGMQGDVDGEVAEGDVLAGRPQRPAVGQLHVAAGVDAGQDARRRRRRRPRRLAGRFQGESQGAANAYQGGGRAERAEHRCHPSGSGGRGRGSWNLATPCKGDEGWHALRYSEGRVGRWMHALRSTSGRATQACGAMDARPSEYLRACHPGVDGAMSGRNY